MYLIRLDDASEYMDVPRWQRLERLLDRYGIRPLVGVIPRNEDETLVGKYPRDEGFWSKVRAWEAKGWTIAMHGYAHVYASRDGGLNPVHLRSEFAGLPLQAQRDKLREGLLVFRAQHLEPKIFFAPAHTFDRQTLEALRLESSIRIISDTVAADVYFQDGFYFIPQQAGRVRSLPFKVTTFCYHPNTMGETDFSLLESFLKKNQGNFAGIAGLPLRKRPRDWQDRALQTLYFVLRGLRNRWRGSAGDGGSN